jgi:hypothetical protein
VGYDAVVVVGGDEVVVLFCSGGIFNGTGALVFGDVCYLQQAFQVMVVGNGCCFIL